MSSPEEAPYERFVHGGELVDGQVFIDRELGEGRVYLLEPVAAGDGRVRALVWGDMAEMSQLEQGPLVRFHSACVYGDVLGMVTCDCGPQLQAAKQAIKDEGQGILFDFMDHEGRGAGLIAKAKGYEITEQLGLNSFKAYDCMGIPRDQRTYTSAVLFLARNGFTIIRFMTNNPDKMDSLDIGSIAVCRYPLEVGRNEENDPYLRSKVTEMGHLLLLPNT